MGLVVLEGLVILVLVLTGFRKAVFHAVPQQLKVAISVGIGLFIALIGFVDAGFVTRIPDAFQTTVPVQLGADGHLVGWPVFVFCLGLALWSSPSGCARSAARSSSRSSSRPCSRSSSRRSPTSVRPPPTTRAAGR